MVRGSVSLVNGHIDKIDDEIDTEAEESKGDKGNVDGQRDN